MRWQTNLRALARRAMRRLHLSNGEYDENPRIGQRNVLQNLVGRGGERTRHVRRVAAVEHSHTELWALKVAVPAADRHNRARHTVAVHCTLSQDVEMDVFRDDRLQPRLLTRTAWLFLGEIIENILH